VETQGILNVGNFGSPKAQVGKVLHPRGITVLAIGRLWGQMGGRARVKVRGKVRARVLAKGRATGRVLGVVGARGKGTLRKAGVQHFRGLQPRALIPHQPLHKIPACASCPIPIRVF
jgi:hypothetical protein